MTLWHILPGYLPDLMSIDGMGESIEPEMVVDDGVAIIPIIGPTSKYGGWGTTATSSVRKLARQAAKSPDVKQVMLYLDTPGGAVSGNSDLAKDMSNLAQLKPTFGYGSDLLASAGYHVASQLGRVFANESALVGSIGTMAMLEDTSEMADKMGIKVHSLATGEHKGVGAFGVPITDAQVDAQRKLVADINEQFISAVASGRNMTPVQAEQLADGRLHTAPKAVQLGLIDGVATLEQSVDELRNYSPNRKVFSMYPTNGAGSAVATLFPGQEPQAQTPQPEAPQPPAAPQPVAPQQAVPEAPPVPQQPVPVAKATIEELEAACPGASPDFLLAQLKAGATTAAAQTAYMALLVQENSALKQAPQVQPEQPVAPVAPAAPVQQPAQQMPGNVLPEVAQSEDEDWVRNPIEFWNEELTRRQSAHVANGLNPHEARMRAVSETIHFNPGLQDAYNAAMGTVPRYTAAN